MADFSYVVFYFFTFLSVYVQVFLLLTFMEKRKSLASGNKSNQNAEPGDCPGVTVIVPCYNEEKTIAQTVRSLLGLNYPEDKLHLVLVDDGSRDGTWQVLKSFEGYKNIKVFQKENGGKYTALNLGLLHTETPFVGCLDSDSFVDPEALRRIMAYFLKDEETMAVAPSIIVHSPQNILQHAQKAEYEMAVYNKKMLCLLGAIHVTPGPFSIFRKKVFDNLGPYHQAHNTEDQEIALRMQANGYKIQHCPEAYVYTISPNTIGKLYRQRTRWITGFIKNAFDYRFLFFRKKYGHLAFFTLPSGFISVLSVIFLLTFLIHKAAVFLGEKILKIKAVGFDFGAPNFGWFFINTQSALFVSIALYALVILGLLLGRRMTEGRFRFSVNIFYFVAIYSILAPLWMLKAIYNSICSKESDWAGERKAA